MAVIITDREFVALLQKQVADEVERQVTAVMKGQTKKQYHDSIGYVRGLRWAAARAEEIRKQNEREG